MMQNTLAKRLQTVKLSPIREIFEMASRTPGLVRLEVGQPDFPTPAHILEAAQKALQEGHIGYSSASGMPETRQALAKRLEEDYGFRFDPETESVICNGASAAIYLTISAIVDPGDEIMRPDPGWAQYDGVIRDGGGIPVLYPLIPEEGFAPDFEALQKLVTPKTKAIIINTPSNPTGGLVTEEHLRKLLDFARNHNIMVISDEAYDKIIYGQKHVPAALLEHERERVVTVGSCSKNYAMCGWRVGYAIGPAFLMSQVMKLQSLVNICPNYIAEKAAAAAFNSPQTATQEMRDEYKRRRDVFVKYLNEIPGISCNMPEGAFYAFADISAYKMDDWEFTRYLIDKVGVTCIPGSSFGEKGKGFVRFSYASSMENLEEGIKRMKQHLPSLLK